MTPRVICVSNDADERQRFFQAQRGLAIEAQWRVHSRVEDVFVELEQATADSPSVVVVGRYITELSQLNLVDALRTMFQHANIIVVLPTREPEIVNRAMLAGAHAALAPEWTDNDLYSALKRVARASVGAAPAQQVLKPQEVFSRPRNVVACVSAKGGVGKSALCALLAHRFARAGMRVAIVDFDVQFGDMRYLYNIMPKRTLHDLLQHLAVASLDPREWATSVAERIDVFTPEEAPEKAELFNGKVAPLLKAISAAYDIVFVNTGSFWALLQVEVIEAATVTMCVTEQSILATRATQTLYSLCSKLDINPHQFMCVVNKIVPYGISQHDVCAALETESTVGVALFERECVMLLDVGNVAAAFELVEKHQWIEDLAFELASRLNVSLQGVEAVRASMKKTPWWRSL